MLVAGTAAALGVGGSARAEPPPVVVSIKPIHSLVASVMEGVGAPHLLLPAGSSPHVNALKPSDMRRLSAAALIVWIGPDLETYLAKPLSDAKLKPRTLSLLEIPLPTKLPRRRGGLWEDGAETADRHGHGHAHGAIDPHLWLDPENARHVVRAVVARLREVDPTNAARYAANGAGAERGLAALEAEIATEIGPAGAARYLVFHDGYQYFERKFALHPSGAIVIDPDRPPGAGRLTALRAKIASGQIRCVFAEPQFAADRVSALLQNTGARAGSLDAYGTDIAAGPAAYGQILRTLAASFRTCLAG